MSYVGAWHFDLTMVVKVKVLYYSTKTLFPQLIPSVLGLYARSYRSIVNLALSSKMRRLKATG